MTKKISYLHGITVVEALIIFRECVTSGIKKYFDMWRDEKELQSYIHVH